MVNPALCESVGTETVRGAVRGVSFLGRHERVFEKGGISLIYFIVLIDIEISRQEHLFSLFGHFFDSCYHQFCRFLSGEDSDMVIVEIEKPNLLVGLPIFEICPCAYSREGGIPSFRRNFRGL